MRNKTQQIYERLIKGGFITVDSIDIDIRHLYNDIEQNEDDYASYFKELGFNLESGEGYYYFSRLNESKQTIEQKLQSFGQWVDILDFLKTFNISFTTGFQFRTTQLLEQINLDVELQEKSRKLFRKQKNYQEIVEKLMEELTRMGYAERINEQDDTYKITSAFRYAEELMNLITVFNEDEDPEL